MQEQGGGRGFHILALSLLAWLSLGDNASTSHLPRRSVAALPARGARKYRGHEHDVPKTSITRGLELRRSPSYPALKDTAVPFVLGSLRMDGPSKHDSSRADSEWQTEGAVDVEADGRGIREALPLNLTALRASVLQGKERLADPYSVPLFVMLPLDTITWEHTVNHEAKLRSQLTNLKEGGYVHQPPHSRPDHMHARRGFGCSPASDSGVVFTGFRE